MEHGARIRRFGSLHLLLFIVGTDVALDPGTGYGLCAEEGGSCSCTGIVKYGTPSQFTTKLSLGSIQCSNESFGLDPAPQNIKNCYCLGMHCLGMVAF